MDGTSKSLDVVLMKELIVTLLHDVYEYHLPRMASDSDDAGVATYYAELREMNNCLERRIRAEGVSFLTKTLPSLGRALDSALTETHPLDVTSIRFQTRPESRLPLFLGELFERVFDNEGRLLPQPCVESISWIRQVSYLFYKYELPYSASQELEVVRKFEETEDDLIDSDQELAKIRQELDSMQPTSRQAIPVTMFEVAREARYLLSDIFAFFDPLDIKPTHGPGAVSTKERLWEKYVFKNVSRTITDKYPYDAYFCASLGHVLDDYKRFSACKEESLPAKVSLVPKDSRGPRLISCEPVDFQWVQGGLRKAIVELVESHPRTRGVVNFTSQEFNRNYALLGSYDGCYATLDLSEASDRVSLELVRLLYPPHISAYLEACRSDSTVLPDGRQLKLRKFAPMGSSLCFPILALTIWALIAAACPYGRGKGALLVYGDDVIVPLAQAKDTIEVLEAFGLKVNRSKSCITGLFRESCGLDAYKGYSVTPVRLRTVWSSLRSPEVYTSWVAYANSFWDMQCYGVYWFICEALFQTYGTIPDGSMVGKSCPSLPLVPSEWLPRKSRTNVPLQKKEWYVLDSKATRIVYHLPGWLKLLRNFAERGVTGQQLFLEGRHMSDTTEFCNSADVCDVSSYTRQRANKLVRRWR
jgi:hypothetical protein